MDTIGDHGIVTIVDEDISIFEKTQLLQAFLFYSGKILLMSLPDIGHYANGGLDHGAQGLHLIGLADARFEDAYLALFVEQTNGKRYSHL